MLGLYWLFFHSSHVGNNVQSKAKHYRSMQKNALNWTAYATVSAACVGGARRLNRLTMCHSAKERTLTREDVFAQPGGKEWAFEVNDALNTKHQAISGCHLGKTGA